MPISINIDVTKLDKSKFFQWKKGVYADLVLWETEPNSESSEYGDYIVKQQGEKGDKMPILGNAKNFELQRRGEKRNGRRTSEREHDENTRSNIPF